VLLVAGAYIWGNRLSADTQSSLSQAGQFRGSQGLAGVRQLDVASAGSAAGSSEFNGSNGVAGVRALDAASSPAGPDSGLKRPRWAGFSVPKADGPGGRGGRTI
jgi:hypothetical protein